MGDYYLAVDIGASSGRHILGTMQDGKIVLEEIYRFENGMVKKDGHLYWDVEQLSKEIIAGMKRCKEIGKVPVTMGIDTWAVDYVLLDKDDQIVGSTYGYRDNRTVGMDGEVALLISPEKLYMRNGIQKLQFNTIYQLMAAKLKEPETLANADSLLMIPDYFNFVLTGIRKSEYTNATTGQLVNVETKDWDWELIETLGFPQKLFLPLTMPGTVVSGLREEIAAQIGYQCQVMQIASHDTASAVISVPTLTEDCLYISSGTWSLLGTEVQTPICTAESKEKNFTNEGGYEYRYRFLKNIMGLWMIQSVRHEFQDAYSFGEICEMAEKEKEFPSRVDVNDDCFLAPENMTEEIKDYCRRTGQLVPESLGQLATVIYQSLAESYAETIDAVEHLTGKKFEAVNIVGGGSNAAYLNELTARKSGRTVFAGPSEATAIGNIAVQMIEAKELEGIKAARKSIFESFGVKEYAPL
ncbi:MAG: rhamnulokinase [Lachnospiraceae bacterium]